MLQKGAEEETPKINKPFSHIAERRVFFYQLSAFPPA